MAPQGSIYVGSTLWLINCGRYFFPTNSPFDLKSLNITSTKRVIMNGFLNIDQIFKYWFSIRVSAPNMSCRESAISKHMNRCFQCRDNSLQRNIVLTHP